MVSQELEEQIQQIINGLSEECRKVFILSRYEGKSHQEIAAELGISVNTVKYHIKNALNALREDLTDYILCILALQLFLFT
ncbi:sigma-70 family RNA polymerase sigma factor [uncultured Bacteroides sp.]|uniref:sigma-70 family RNA polymerase sigma factor n=1 Tax=uncultured Bacteroides sp. TaxID=162156 RepID=UPI00258676E0|nr:sigma-70 family RNA polymerase sigma factor [uncultured Bacteroides sp.]